MISYDNDRGQTTWDEHIMNCLEYPEFITENTSD